MLDAQLASIRVRFDSGLTGSAPWPTAGLLYRHAPGQFTGMMSACEPPVVPTENVSGTMSLAATLGTMTLNW